MGYPKERKETAPLFNVGHYPTVSQTTGRLNILMDENSGVAGEFNVLSQDLTPLASDPLGFRRQGD